MIDHTAYAHDTLPGYRDTQALLDAVRKIPLPVARGASSTDIVAADVTAALQAGETLDLLDIATRAAAEINAVSAGRTGLLEAQSTLKRQLTEMVENNPDHFLAAMNTALVEIVKQVKALHPLAEIRDETAAVDSDRARDFTRLRELTTAYTRIRTDQLSLVRKHDSGALPLSRDILAGPDIPSVFPRWAQWCSPGHIVHAQSMNQMDVRPPWPVPEDDGERPTVSHSVRSFAENLKSPAFLLWAIKAGVELWVPTLEQIRDMSVTREAQLDPRNRTVEIDDEWIDPDAARGTLRDDTEPRSILVRR